MLRPYTRQESYKTGEGHSLSLVPVTTGHAPVNERLQELTDTSEQDKSIEVQTNSNDEKWLTPADLVNIMASLEDAEFKNKHWSSLSGNPVLDPSLNSVSSSPNGLNALLGVEDGTNSSIASQEIGFLGTQIQPSDIIDVLGHICSSENDGTVNQQTLNLLITSFSRNEFFSEERNVNLPVTLFVLGQLLLKRADVLKSVVDADRAIEYLTKASRISHREDTLLAPTLHALARAHQRRFMRYGGVADIHLAIEYQNQTIAAPSDKHDNYGAYTGELGNLFWLRHGALGDLDDINRAIECQVWALDFFAETSDHKANTLNNLGNSYMSRYERLGEVEDINKAIDCQIRATELTPDEHPNRPSQFSNLGNSYLCRFERLGQLECINKAIESHIKAALLSPAGHPDRPSQFSNLGISYLCRFERLDELEDIHKAIMCHTQAVELTPEGHTEIPSRFSNLGVSYITRYERLGDVEDISRAINCHAHAAELTPEKHPKRPSRFNNLGVSYKFRFERLGVLEDINKAIGYLIEAIQHSPHGHLNIPTQLNNLGISYKLRFERLGQPEDIRMAIDCQTQAVQLSPPEHPDSPSQFGNLGNSYMSRFQRLGQLEDINMAIDCQTQAVQLTPEEHPNRPGQFSNLGNSYLCRFERLGKLTDIRQAINYQTQAVEITPQGHPAMPSYFSNLGISYLCRFERLGELEDISKSIECQTQAVGLTPQEHSDIPNRFNNLGNSYLYRFQRSGDLEDVNKAIELFTQAVSRTPHRHSNLPAILSSLGIAYSYRVNSGGSTSDFGKGIEASLRAAHETLDGHVEKPSRLHNLGQQFMMRFQHLQEPKDIESAIENYTRALQLLPNAHVQTSIIQYVLGSTHYTRLRSFGNSQDMIIALGYLESAARSATGIPIIRFQASRDWARHLVHFNRPASLPAHRTAMQLLPEVIWLGTTSIRRYERIIEVGTVTVEAAAAAISAKEYGQALEWLAEGRYIVWNQILQLRTPCEVLASVNPVLAEELQLVSKDLECASRRKPSTVSVGFNPATLEQATLQHHRLMDQYTRIIGQARSLPGFHDFMRPKQAADLMTGAKLGPVVVVNVDADSCDALILFPSSEKITHLPLPHLSQAGVFRLHERLQHSLGMSLVRNRGVQQRRVPLGDHLKQVLTALWYQLVKPVLDSLGYSTRLPVDQLPHITWCSTGALTFLPIHAAGAYGSSGDRIFDFAITSYTPTLTALLPAISESPAEVSSVLAVGQVDTAGMSDLPGVTDELNSIERHVANLPHMVLEGTQATPAAVLESMEKYSCVHLACHASQDIDAPTQSGFHLHTGILSLEAIAQQSLKNKSLAVLTACQTATGHLKLPDEAIHLAAGMLVAGYPSVIATMWTIDDRDAPLVADVFYGELMEGGKLNCRQAARALHTAICALRDKIGEQNFIRWVPFIHIGQ